MSSSYVAPPAATKSAWWGAAKELSSGAPATANNNDGDIAVANDWFHTVSSSSDVSLAGRP